MAVVVEGLGGDALAAVWVGWRACLGGEASLTATASSAATAAWTAQAWPARRRSFRCCLEILNDHILRIGLLDDNLAAVADAASRRFRRRLGRQLERACEIGVCLPPRVVG